MPSPALLLVTVGLEPSWRDGMAQASPQLSLQSPRACCVVCRLSPEAQALGRFPVPVRP